MPIEWGEKAELRQINIEGLENAIGFIVSDKNKYPIILTAWTCPVCQGVVTTIREKREHQKNCMKEIPPEKKPKRAKTKQKNRAPKRAKTKQKNIHRPRTKMMVNNTPPIPVKNLVYQKQIMADRNNMILQNRSMFEAWKKKNRK